jgi:hypothetical protein
MSNTDLPAPDTKGETSMTAGSHNALAEPRCVRVTFDECGTAAKPVAAAFREALALAFPAVDFTLRYRTSQTFRPSWVEISWRGPPSEADADSALDVVMHEISAERKRKLRASPLRKQTGTEGGPC